MQLIAEYLLSGLCFYRSPVSLKIRKKVIQVSVLLMGVIVLYRFGKWQKYDRTVSFEKAIEGEPTYDSNPENQYFPKEPTFRQVQENMLLNLRIIPVNMKLV